ncbi:adenylate kinase [Candidatus Cyrtobacter comes]|uniref:Adenylate kinase n=1 Tax=Candidatus Cyrtobacter comes TaxID=675776 RepID=A0ABU5L6I7_9RICK|nr:adenylate kinase [Candidatus Cyrtobacter comes]MDZ5761742.1 adenylate kinase [Candidatus Cyrtobacter comes]
MKFILFGMPGVGKGTQSALLSDHYEIPKLSTGEVLRHEMENNSEIGARVAQIMRTGGLVPDEVVEAIVEARIRSESCKKGFILDGFPRTLNQAVYLDLLLKKIGCFEDIFIIYLVVDKERLASRILGRFLCSACGNIFHESLNQLVKINGCTRCGCKKFIYRDDDEKENIKNRIKIYQEQTFPLIEFYRGRKRFLEVDADASIEVVFKNITFLLDKVDIN